MRPQAFIAALFALALALVVLSCGGDDASSSTAGGASEVEDSPSAYLPKAYTPDPAEDYANGKRLAARIAQRTLTYEPGTSPLELARSLPRSATGEQEMARILAPSVDDERSSVGEVVYPQLSGVTPSSMGAMVITRQVLQDADGEREIVVRVLDVRLRLSGDAWALEEIASVGGAPVARPTSLPAAAERVLDNPNITLSDSARWDVYAGRVDDSLLDALANASEQHELFVGIIRSGHPTNVWATSRPSAHSQGLAADIHAVDGRLVVHQQRTGSAAYDLAQELAAGGAYQLGSPWVFGAGGVSSFTDPVHRDHLHLQQSPPS
jgi:hypothetical protein